MSPVVGQTRGPLGISTMSKFKWKGPKDRHASKSYATEDPIELDKLDPPKKFKRLETQRRKSNLK